MLRHCRMSSYKVREVLDLIRGRTSIGPQRDPGHHARARRARVVAKLLRSAAANAEHNDGLDPGELFVATCYADEGTTAQALAAPSAWAAPPGSASAPATSP